MSNPKKTVLITGCSDGGMGAALALAFHDAGLHVYATARSPEKMTQLTNRGITTLPLDVQSTSSIGACVAQVPALDILVNNAGANYMMPVVDVDIAEAKNIFDLNVWAQLAVTQAFMPLLIKSKGMVASHTSSTATVHLPCQGIYNASKAALATLTDNLRLELQAFDVEVVDLRTGFVRSNFVENHRHNVPGRTHEVPKGSIYEPAGDAIRSVLWQEKLEGTNYSATKWATGVVSDLLSKSPPPVIYRGKDAALLCLIPFLPTFVLDRIFKSTVGFDVVERIIRGK